MELSGKTGRLLRNLPVFPEPLSKNFKLDKMTKLVQIYC